MNRCDLRAPIESQVASQFLGSFDRSLARLELMRINVGCGQSPTPGWTNYDNSPSVRLARRPVWTAALRTLGILDQHQLDFIEFCKSNGIEFASGLRLPIQSNIVDVHYSSHTLEHLDRIDARQFLLEAKRVLKPGGIIRIAVPNLMFYAKKYALDGDLDYFMFWLHTTRPALRGIRQKMKYLWVGDRHHQWMYDGPHLCNVLMDCGFISATVLEPGETTIQDPGPLNLRERVPESLFVEACKPPSGKQN